MVSGTRTWPSIDVLGLLQLDERPVAGHLDLVKLPVHLQHLAQVTLPDLVAFDRHAVGVAHVRPPVVEGAVDVLINQLDVPLLAADIHLAGVIAAGGGIQVWLALRHTCMNRKTR